MVPIGVLGIHRGGIRVEGFLEAAQSVEGRRYLVDTLHVQACGGREGRKGETKVPKHAEALGYDIILFL